MSLVFERVDAGQAQRFWDDSPHASVFTHPGVLEALAGHVDWWQCRKGAEPICLWPVAPDWARRSLRVPWTMYVGPMWSSRAWCMPAHRWLGVSQRVHVGLATRILQQCGGLYAQLPPGLADVRAFEWAREDGTLQGLGVRPRYSALIAVRGRPEAEILADWRPVRRNEMRRATRLVVRLRGDPPLAEVSRLYEGIFKRQRCAPPAGPWEALPTLLALARAGHGTAFAAEVGGRPACVGVLLHDRSATHLVLAAVDDEFRTSGVLALVTLESIRFAVRKGSARFDFNGANSPRRGDDKHSYGALPSLFFELCSDRSQSDAA